MSDGMQAPTGEAEVAEWLELLRWPGGFACPLCAGRRHYRIDARPRVRECAGCGRQQSVTAGTAMHGMKLRLVVWWRAIMRVMAGTSALALAREVGVTYETAFQLMHKVRRVLEDEFPQVIADPDAVDLTRLGRTTMPMRPPWKQPSRVVHALVCYPSGREWVFGCSVDERAARLVYASLGVERAGYEGQDHVFDARRVIARRYRGVSPRWVDRYLAERAADVAPVGRALVVRLVGAPPRPWWTVPPALPAQGE